MKQIYSGKNKNVYELDNDKICKSIESTMLSERIFA